MLKESTLILFPAFSVHSLRNYFSTVNPSESSPQQAPSGAGIPTALCETSDERTTSFISSEQNEA